jgi:hypothetical protein
MLVCPQLPKFGDPIAQTLRKARHVALKVRIGPNVQPAELNERPDAIWHLRWPWHLGISSFWLRQKQGLSPLLPRNGFAVQLIGIGETIDLKKLPAKLTWLVSILDERASHLSWRRGARRHLVLCERSLLIRSGPIWERTALDVKIQGLCLDSHVFRFAFSVELNAVKFRPDKKRKVSTGFPALYITETLRSPQIGENGLTPIFERLVNSGVLPGLLLAIMQLTIIMYPCGIPWMCYHATLPWQKCCIHKYLNIKVLRIFLFVFLELMSGVSSAEIQSRTSVLLVNALRKRWFFWSVSSHF